MLCNREGCWNHKNSRVNFFSEHPSLTIYNIYTLLLFSVFFSLPCERSGFCYCSALQVHVLPQATEAFWRVLCNIIQWLSAAFPWNREKNILFPWLVPTFVVPLLMRPSRPRILWHINNQRPPSAFFPEQPSVLWSTSVLDVRILCLFCFPFLFLVLSCSCFFLSLFSLVLVFCFVFVLFSFCFGSCSIFHYTFKPHFKPPCN